MKGWIQNVTGTVHRNYDIWKIKIKIQLELNYLIEENMITTLTNNYHHAFPYSLLNTSMPYLTTPVIFSKSMICTDVDLR